ncbi:hypothetical protein J3R30DRAFT_1350356 [Lentinula aciculospora]|uniref:Uncharacterized protein n=1 Tax=Lentinula aciculospora TaxID=153920 RepID=A0A9W9DUE3_9AGAR|nr:hypothetical protein J3R30DRAFT_1350356 [Lentinula aciculospora]
MYLNPAYLVLIFVSSTFAIPLTPVSTNGIQTRSEPLRPGTQIHITFPTHSIGNPDKLTETEVCDRSKQALEKAALILPELKDLQATCGTYPGTRPSKSKESIISFVLNIARAPESTGVAFCNPVCIGTIHVKTGRIYLTGRRITRGNKEIAQMVLITEQGLEVPWQSDPTKASPAPESGTHITIDSKYNLRGTGPMTKEEIQKSVQNMLDYVPDILPEMKTPLSFTFGKNINPGPPISSSGFLQVPPMIYFKLTPSPKLDFCNPTCDGRILVKEDIAFILGSRSTMREGMKIERMIKIVPIRKVR